MNILITGASGFIGSHLIAFFQTKGFELSVLTRDKNRLNNRFNHHQLNIVESLDEIADDFEFDVIINLAGAPIDQRWSEAYKQQLIDSRIKMTQSLYQLIARLNSKPKTLISASAVGYYGSHGDEVLDETAKPNSKSNSEFTNQLCQQWEDQAFKIAEFNEFVEVLIPHLLGLDIAFRSKILSTVA